VTRPRSYALAAPLTAAALALTSCTTSGGTAATTSSYTAHATAEDEQAFLLTTRVAGIPGGNPADDKTTLNLGHDICTQYGAGTTYRRVLAAGEHTMPLRQRETVATAAARFLCPEYQRMLPHK
jgi:hypothetical protein